MNTGTNNSNNNFLTLVLYLLLAGLILAVGYKACQMKKEKAANQQHEAEMQQALRDLGYTDEDSTGSIATDNEDDSSPAARYKDGTSENKTQTEIAKPMESAKTKPAPVEVQDEEGETVKVSDLDREAADDGGGNSSKYMVITGSFKLLSGARTEMENLVKLGYSEAEVGRFNRGKYACAIALRTNDLATAKSAVAKLQAKGFKTAFIKTKK